MIEPPAGGEDSDMESENEEIVDATGLPNEVAGKMEVFQITSNEVPISCISSGTIWNTRSDGFE